MLSRCAFPGNESECLLEIYVYSVMSTTLDTAVRLLNRPSVIYFIALPTDPQTPTYPLTLNLYLTLNLHQAQLFMHTWQDRRSMQVAISDTYHSFRPQAQTTYVPLLAPSCYVHTDPGKCCLSAPHWCILIGLGLPPRHQPGCQASFLPRYHCTHPGTVLTLKPHLIQEIPHSPPANFADRHLGTYAYITWTQTQNTNFLESIGTPQVMALRALRDTD